jgi:hypothetical protein
MFTQEDLKNSDYENTVKMLNDAFIDYIVIDILDQIMKEIRTEHNVSFFFTSGWNLCGMRNNK